MRQFLIQTVIFLSAGGLLLSVLPAEILPYYYGDKVYAEKHKIFHGHADKYNTILFGTSRIYRQIIPTLLDSLVTQTNISSFNMATAATNGQESAYLYEHFLDELKPGQIEFVILELQRLNWVSPDNLNTTKGNYWINAKTIARTRAFLRNAEYPEVRKKTLLRNQYKGLANKYLDFGKMANSAGRFLTSVGDFRSTHGYISSEQATRTLSKGQQFRARSTAFLQDTSILRQRVRVAAQIDSLHNTQLKVNAAYLQYHLDLIANSDQKGIHLILVLPPKLIDYREHIAIAKQLPLGHFIDLANVRKYPELYLAKNTFDRGHLNTRGSRLLTTYLAQELDDRLKKQE